MIEITEFEKILKSLFQFTISEKIVYNISVNEIVKDIFGKNKSIENDYLKVVIKNQDNRIKKALLERVLLISNILEAYNKSNFDNVKSINSKEIWKLVYNSLITFHTDEILASVGSQGFLSIPLYRYESKCGDIDILRLHIWDKSLNKYVDKNTISEFSIHSHTFSTQSWILAGEVYNTRYLRGINKAKTNLNYFRINFAKSLLNVKDNDKKSYLENTYIMSYLIPSVKESYIVDKSYRMDAGEFHLSEVNEQKDINATLFLFSSRKSKVDFSYVLGSKDSKLPHSLNYEKFDCKYLIEKLNSKISTYE